MPLAENTIKTVEATAGLVAAQGIDFTREFYERMLGSNEELKDIFNLAHQVTLRQPQALFDSVVAYALNIRKINNLFAKVEKGEKVADAELLELQGFFSVAERVAQKHTSFGIRPDQYSIVGSNLLATIEARVTQDKAILGEWGKAYEFLANLFIKREEEIYQEVAARPHGWRPTRTFRVAEKTKVNDIVFKFKLVPSKKGEGVALHKPGQFIAIFARNPTYFKYQEIRQYSIVSAPNSEFYEIAVRKDEKGVVSQYLHDHVNVDDQLELAPPYGDFFLEYMKPSEKAAEDKVTSVMFRKLQNSSFNFAEHKNTPLVFISGGIGQTPLLSMLKFLAKEEGKETTRPLFWIHAAHNSAQRVFKNEVADLQKALPTLRTFTFLTETTAGDKEGEDYNAKGRIDLNTLPVVFALESEAQALPHYFFVGPMGFMQVVEKQLLDKKIPSERIHFEMFGPFKSLV